MSDQPRKLAGFTAKEITVTKSDGSKAKQFVMTRDDPDWLKKSKAAVAAAKKKE